MPPKAQLASVKAMGKCKRRKKLGQRLLKLGKMTRNMRMKRDAAQGPKKEWLDAAAANFPGIQPDLLPALLQMPDTALPDTSKRHGAANYTVSLENAAKVQVHLGKEQFYVVAVATGKPAPANRTAAWRMFGSAHEAWAEARVRAGLPSSLGKDSTGALA